MDERVGFEVDGETLRVRDALEGEKLPLRVNREPDPVRLEFDRPTTVTIGARSLHTRPEATIPSRTIRRCPTA